jgi:DNA sulfur modification protein DndD
VTLLDGQGEEIPVPSAGEKEIFALSLIHGLGKLSPAGAARDRHAPGSAGQGSPSRDRCRLHSSGSHQVIVLSTDSEIDDELYEVIRPHLAWQATIRASENGAFVDTSAYFEQGPL